MKNKIILYLLLCPYLLVAQTGKLDWGIQQNIDGFVSEILGSDNNNLYVLVYKNKEYHINTFQKTDFKETASKELKMPKSNNDEEDFEAIYLLKNNFILFTSYYDKSADKFSTYAYKVDKEGKIDLAKIQISEVQANKKKEKGNYFFTLSEDSTKIVVYNTQELKKEDKQLLSVKIINENLKIVDNFEQSLPISDGNVKMEVFDVMCDNAGNVFYKEKFSLTSNKEASYKVGYYNAATKKVKYLDVDVSAEKISHMKYKIKQTGILDICGYYCKRGDGGMFSYDGIIGVYFITFDVNENKVISKNMQDFDKALMKSYLTEKQLEKGKLIPALFEPRAIEKRADGGQILISEYYMRSESDNGRTKMTTTYFFDIMVTSINKDGTIAWTRIIPKKQIDVQQNTLMGIGFVTVSFPTKRSDIQYYSFFQKMQDNKLVLFYNEIPENLNLADKREYDVAKSTKRSVPTIAIIDQEGNIKVESLVDTKLKDEVNLRTGIFQINNKDNKIIVYGTKRGLDKFGTITF